MAKVNYISHLRKDATGKWIIQTNEEHCRNVGRLSSIFASEFNSSEWGKIIGLLHDLGKEGSSFQDYIKMKSGYAPNIRHAKHVPHAYVGAIVANCLYPTEPPILSYCIMGHHAGLPDCNDLGSKMILPLPNEINFPAFKDTNLQLPFKFGLSDIHLWIRMLYSSIVDADYLDTEAFMNKEQAILRKNKANIQDLYNKLCVYLEYLQKRVPDTYVNRIRVKIQQECSEASSKPSGFFSLTVPTGGGKTLSSLLWAMKHALIHGKRRIIIAIPYTSIIIQTAETLREIFGSENVLEDHSNVIKREYENSLHGEQMRLATENWDFPIIVTTNVQLFESLFSNRPSKCRKLHNICNSILILDEVQTLPLNYLRPIVDSLKTLQAMFGVSVIFTTASQPALAGEIRYGKMKKDSFEGIQNIHEIISNPSDLSNQLRRVEIHIDSKCSDYKGIAQRIKEYNRVLCIVNTRSDAKEIYTHLHEDDSTYHLSRMMCPVHIRETIDKIKQELKSNKTSTIRVIATQLIEAGVDIDFPVVFRQEAGLDSIIQAAGRCNREGELEKGETYVFKLNKPLPIGSISLSVAARERLDKNSDWLDPGIINSYFEHLYYNVNSLDEAQICSKLYTKQDFYFKMVAEKFHLIDDNGVRVVVNYKNSVELIDKLKLEGPSYQLIKELNQYTVTLREKDFKNLYKYKLINEIVEGIFFLGGIEQYSVQKGLILGNYWLDEVLIK